MKKQLAGSIILLIALISPTSRLMGNEKFGIKAGLLTSYIHIQWEDSSNLKSVGGFEVGGSYTFPITKYFSLQPEINYSMEGFQSYNVYSHDLEPIKYRLIKIPLLLNCTFSYIPFEFFAGPYIAFRIGKEIYRITSYVFYDGKIKKTDLGLAWGLRINLKKIFPKSHMFIELHGNLGLKSFIEDYSPDKKQLRRSLAFMVGCRF
jgi:hypothetical protein